MKLYISVDMEGMAGTFSWNQEKTDRSSVRKYITQQLEWLLEGIHASAANSQITEIAIADSHSQGDNILYEFTAFDDRLHLISGAGRPQYMMPALDESYDLVMFAGYHGGVGMQNANMDHTYSASAIHKIWMQNIPMNESLINAAYAGYYGIPVGLVTGDEALRKALIDDNAMPWIQFVTTKYALGKFSAKQRPIAKVKQESIAAAKNLLDSDITKLPVYAFETPITMRIEFQTTVQTDYAALMPGVKRVDGRIIEFTHEDYRVMFDAIMAVVLLARSN